VTCCGGAAHRVVGFVRADPEAPPTGLRRTMARRALTYYGSPLAVPARGLDHPLERILAAATGLHPVPVRDLAS
jgi:hypothetical protein